MDSRESTYSLYEKEKERTCYVRIKDIGQKSI